MEYIPLAYQYLFSLVVTIVLTNIPYIGKYFKVINTMIHESAHAIVSLLLNAEVVQIELFSNTSGTTLTKTNSKWKRFLISFVGYPFATATAWLIYMFAIYKWYTAGLIFLLIIVILNLIFFVRNIYGIFWLITYGLLIGTVLYFNNTLAITVVLYITAGIILVESLISIIQLLIIAYKQPDKAGDAKNLKDITQIPALFWVFVFLFLSCYILWNISRKFLIIPF
jgi:hypothetical protein